MSIETCPPPDELGHLFSGSTADPDASALEQHVLECGACLKKLQGLDDTRTDLLAGASTEHALPNPVVAQLVEKLKSLRAPRTHPPIEGKPMLTITCSNCQKKLSVKEELAGKKVKCPGCGKATLAPAKVAVAAAGQEERTLPPTPMRDSPTIPPSQVNASDAPTNPPADKPEATVGIDEGLGHDSSLTDFLAPPQADDELGRLGKYRILKILGHGGMGVVYRADDPKLKRSVAIKAMLPTLAASASCGKRFMREAETMAQVKHDHVVNVYDVVEERGIPFMVMEFLKGEPLDERLKREEQIPLPELLRIGREIAEGLGAAHALELIHRDIKPGNIWLEAPRGRVKILDFGLARATSQDSGLTQQGAIIGTPAYMAPEQGRGGNVDARCDLFSLGVVLYRMATGVQPFQGNDTVATLMAVAMNDPAEPIKIKPELPQQFSELVMKLLEKDPEKRIATAAEVVETLRALERKLERQQMNEGETEALEEGIRAGAPSPARERLKKEPARPASAKTRRSIAGLALVGIAALCLFCVVSLGGVVFYWQTNNGVVKIEINDPDIKVNFDKKELVFNGVDKQQELRLSPGAFGLHVKRGDLEFDTDKPIVIKRGDVVTLKIEWQKDGKLLVMQGGDVIGQKLAKAPIGPAPLAPASRWALAFDGKSSHVTVPSLNIDGDHPLTAEAWAVLDRPSGDGVHETLVSANNVTGFSLGTGYDLKWSFGLFWGDKGGAYALAREKQPLPRHQLVHLAGVYDGRSEIRFYLNGQLQSRAAIQGYQPTIQPFILGARANNQKRYFLGRMDEVRVSKVARYSKDFIPQARFEPDADTLALYHLDEGQGDVLKDSSGNGHHGKIIGAKWVKADGTPITPNVTPPAAISPLDALDAAKIPAEEREPNQPKELVAVVGSRQMRHWGGQVHSVAISRDGKTIASAAGGDNKGRLWDATTLREKAVIDDVSRFVAFFPDGKTLVTHTFSGANRPIRLWDISGPTPKELPHPKGVETSYPLLLHLADDAPVLALLSRERKSIQVSDLSTAPPKIWHIPVPKDLLNASWLILSPDGKRVALVHTTAAMKKSGEIAWWTLSGTEFKEQPRVPAEGVQRVIFSSDGKSLAVAGDNGIAIWNLDGSTPAQRSQVTKSRTGYFAWAPNGQRIIAGTGNVGYELYSYDVSDITQRPIPLKDAARYAVFSADSKWIAQWNLDNNVRIFDLSGPTPVERTTPISRVHSMAFTLNGKTLISRTNEKTYVWDIVGDRFELRTKLDRSKYNGEGNIAVSSDGTTLASSHNDEISLWNLTEKTPTILASGAAGGARLIAYVPGTRVVAYTRENTIRFIEPNGLAIREVSSFEGHTKPIIRSAFSDDGKVLACLGSDGTVQLWTMDKLKAEKQALVQAGEGKARMTSVALSPDGKTLATRVEGAPGDGNQCWLWDIAGKEVKRRVVLNGGKNRAFSCLVFSPDGRTLASSGQELRVGLWHVATGAKLREFASPDSVGDVAFAPDSRHLAIANLNGTVYIVRVDAADAAGIAPATPPVTGNEE